MKNSSRFKKGGIPWNKNKKGLQIGHFKGKKLSIEHIKKLKISHLKGGKYEKCSICKKSILISPARQKNRLHHCSRKCYAVWIRKSKIHSGNNNWNWKGGITSLKKRIITLPEYIEWRNLVYKRDDYTCQECGSTKSNNFNCHHLIPFSYILKVYNIKNIKNALDCKILWDINNGQTLCIPCHKKTDTYSIKVKKLLIKYKTV